MDMSDFWKDILVILLLIIFNGILALSEAAMLSVRKARLQNRINDGDKRARLALKLAENPNRFLSTIQIGITVIDVLISLAFIGTVPWREAIHTTGIGSIFMERLYGKWAARLLSGMILVTAFGSVFALLLGYSRIPYAAAKDGIFFRSLGVLHPRDEFPHRSLLLVGALCIGASFFTLGQVISALMTARILVQFLGQVVAVLIIRWKRPEIQRPFRMWLYPLPAIVSFGGYTYVFGASGLKFILYGLLTLAAGMVAYFITARRQGAWPFEKAGEVSPALPR